MNNFCQFYLVTYVKKSQANRLFFRPKLRQRCRQMRSRVIAPSQQWKPRSVIVSKISRQQRTAKWRNLHLGVCLVGNGIEGAGSVAGTRKSTVSTGRREARNVYTSLCIQSAWCAVWPLTTVQDGRNRVRKNRRRDSFFAFVLPPQVLRNRARLLHARNMRHLLKKLRL